MTLVRFAFALIVSQAVFFAGWFVWHRSRRHGDFLRRFSRWVLEPLRGAKGENSLHFSPVSAQEFFDKPGAPGGNAHQRRIQRRKRQRAENEFIEKVQAMRSQRECEKIAAA